ncbi:MAG: ABC transporter substrate-binding protein [Clostridia bacterium]|nr:ABC transporter substrate-binding protein [Clostridia bacterium]
MKRFFALTLIFSLIFTAFCGCKKEPENPDDPQIVTNLNESSESTLRLAYSKADMLDPFACTMSANIQILGLIYDTLYKLDKNYEPVPVIAKSSIVSGTAINVTLNSVMFSDGTVLTAGDVAYSFEKAKKSPYYSERLKNFESVSISSSDMLVFTLTQADPYALACLTFPIVKNGAEGELPTGSGRYTAQVSGETTYLVVNSKKTGFNPAIKTIMLVPVRDSSSVESSLEIGNTGFYYNDLSGGTYSRINAQTVEMGINNFVYLAFNSSSEILSNQLIRQAVNLAVNRSEIAATAFQGHARPAYSPFNPDWYKLASKDLVISVDTDKAKELILQSGIDISQKELSLLVNKENQFKLEAAQFISSYLTALGFKVVLKDYEPEYYTEAIELGSYDMYIGEIRLTYNMDLSPLLGGSQGYGINPSCVSASRYSQHISGGCELMDFVNTFNEDLPFIPLCYRNAAASYTNAVQAEFNCCDGDVFYDIETWSFK